MSVTIAAAALLTAAAGAAGDSVALKNGLVYSPATVMKCSDGVLSFRLLSGAKVHKSLSEIAAIEMGGAADFNRAEQFLKGGKYAQAVRAYAAAEKRTTVTWRKVLIQCRMLQAAEGGGDIEEAVKRWLALIDAGGATKGALALRPRKLLPSKSAGNDRAINILRAKSGAVKSPPYLRAIQAVLVDLYEHQGRLEEARALAAKLAGQGAKVGPPDNGDDPPPVVTTGANAAVLKAASLSLQSGRPQEVIRRLEPALTRFSAAELPSALCLLGRAQAALAKSTKDTAEARSLLLAGGLNLMRVVALFPRSREVSDALLAAGEVNEGLKNVEAARAAYAELLARHAKSSAARQAEEGLKRLEGK